MKVRHLFLALFFISGSFLFAEDCYAIPAVKSWVELPRGMAEGSSFVEKQVYRAGDRVALGIVHAFTEQELMEPDRLERALDLLRLAFSRPEYVTNKEDRSPAVTLLLLHRFRELATSENAKKRIAETTEYVLAQTKPKH